MSCTRRTAGRANAPSRAFRLASFPCAARAFRPITFPSAVFLAATLLAAALGGCQAGDAGGPLGGLGLGPRPQRTPPRPLPRQVRGVWVARFHYQNPDDVRTIIANCAALGCNTVFWQVRGEGTVSYPSRLEPWGREFGFRDPGFDPLALAVAEAHRRGLRIEAWANVMPGWKGPQAPPISGQLWNAHPDWFLHDAAGRPQPLGDYYMVLNPCLPEVRRHVTRVMEEVVSRYDVDGLHLDYCRYAWEGVRNARNAYPRDARTVALYRRETGREPGSDAAWDHWRANQLTRLIQDIREAVNRRRPGASVTAAVWRNPGIGYQDYLQNSVAWLRAGLVDALMPMAYTADTRQFERDIATYRELARVGGRPRRVVPGLGIYQHESAESMRQQLRRCAGWGGDFALFSYESLFPTAGDRGASATARERNNRLRALRRDVLAEVAGAAAAR